MGDLRKLIKWILALAVVAFIPKNLQIYLDVRSQAYLQSEDLRSLSLASGSHALPTNYTLM